MTCTLSLVKVYQFTSSTPEIEKGQTSGSQHDAEQEKESTSSPTDCASGCCELTPIPFQPKDDHTLENTRKQQVEKCCCFTRQVGMNLTFGLALHYTKSSFRYLLSVLAHQKPYFRKKK